MPIRLLLSDVDGTLVNPEKELTADAIEAVRALGAAGVAFAVTSSRPPRGLAMLIEPLSLITPISAFNGGLIVDRDLATLDEKTLTPEVVTPLTGLLHEHDLDVWLYRGADWLVTDPDGAHVAHESATVAFGPQVVPTFDGVTANVAKLVGVSDDHDAVARAATAAQEAFGGRVSATGSQPYYVDVTHPDANKGGVVRYLSRLTGIPAEEIATIGDGSNDVLMFKAAGTSIAMGNASDEVRASATHVTAANDAEGFATAVEQRVLPAAP